MVSPARLAAYDALRSVTAGRQDLPAALSHARRRLADERDRSLAAEIATGTLRWLGQLDHVIQAFAKRPASRMDAEVLDVLRLTAYQILHLDRIPVSAAVDEAVDLVKRRGKRSAAGFVNGVLRSITRARRALPLPSRPSDVADEARALDYLSISLSHPRWLAARWLARGGFDAAEQWAQFNNTAAPLTIRANTLRTSRAALADALAAHDVQTEPGRFAPDALVVVSGNPLRTPLVETGAFFVQDEVSQLVGLFTLASPGERVLDACASPGGKTMAMAALMHDSGLIVAGDFRPRRVDLLKKTMAAAGPRSVRIVRADVRRPLPFRAPFDCVLVDAPCSGLGTIRRDPEIRWRRREEDLAGYAAAQLGMLDQAASVVRTGGRVVYSTCSSEPEENEEVVAGFLDTHPGFRLDDPRSRADVPAGLAAVLDAQGCLRTMPNLHGLECFFAAMLRRAGDEGPASG